MRNPTTIQRHIEIYRKFISSGLSGTQFCKQYGISNGSFWRAQKFCNLAGDYNSSESYTIVNMKQPEEMSQIELLAELASLRKEKRELQRKLERAELRVEANEMLIDLAESTYHIKVRKNSDAK